MTATCSTRRSRQFARVVAAATTGYAAGLVPSADVAAKLASRGRVDLREHGSGNPDGANALAPVGLCGDGGRHSQERGGVPDRAPPGRRCRAARRWRRRGRGPLLPGDQWVPRREGRGLQRRAVPSDVPGLPPDRRRCGNRGSLRTVAAASVRGHNGVLGGMGRRQHPVGAARLANAWGGPPTIALPLAAAASSAVIFRRVGIRLTPRSRRES